MATTIVYEPQYKLSGWFDDGGLSPVSWFDRDLAGTIIPLVRAEPIFFVNQNTIYAPPPLTVEILPALFVNQSTFFSPTGVRTLIRPDQMLKNEVRRLR
jgi:hypothetical protein